MKSIGYSGVVTVLLLAPHCADVAQMALDALWEQDSSYLDTDDEVTTVMVCRCWPVEASNA